MVREKDENDTRQIHLLKIYDYDLHEEETKITKKNMVRDLQIYFALGNIF